ncbi:hypothetical protein [Streptomyces sp. NPDC058678]|uniref:hypothetical protein n=1 Tax=Streptomyces sp. NPDC058678 TaxID=3346595 RepID=UPI00364F6309
MRPHTMAASEAEPAVSKKSIRRWLAPAMSLGLAPLILLASPGSASAQTWCFKSDGASYRPGDTTWAKPKIQARNTWEDWVWRGPKFQCPVNAPKCTYSYGQDKTTSWEWSIGLKVDVAIPKVGKLFEVSPSYKRGGSTTTKYMLSVDLKPGQYTQPIMVVKRRWVQGTYVGAFRTDGSSCGSGKQRFWWDGDYQFGKWQTNIRVDDYATYNTYPK